VSSLRPSVSFLRKQEPRLLCVCPLVSFPRKRESRRVTFLRKQQSSPRFPLGAPEALPQRFADAPGPGLRAWDGRWTFCCRSTVRQRLSQLLGPRRSPGLLDRGWKGLGRLVDPGRWLQFLDSFWRRGWSPPFGPDIPPSTSPPSIPLIHPPTAIALILRPSQKVSCPGACGPWRLSSRFGSGCPATNYPRVSGNSLYLTLCSINRYIKLPCSK
jgi:hypothetical protein